MLVLLFCALLLSQTAPAADAPDYVRKYLERCERAGDDSAKATRQAPLPLPPKKDDVGVFVIDAAGRESRLDVLEVEDGRNVIVRAWYDPSDPPAKNPPGDLTFVDLWIEEIDTQGLKAGPIKAADPKFRSIVFHVKGSKTFGTTCGSRAMPLLEPIDLISYGAKTQPTK